MSSPRARNEHTARPAFQTKNTLYSRITTTISRASNITTRMDRVPLTSLFFLQAYFLPRPRSRLTQHLPRRKPRALLAPFCRWAQRGLVRLAPAQKKPVKRWERFRRDGWGARPPDPCWPQSVEFVPEKESFYYYISF